MKRGLSIATFILLGIIFAYTYYLIYLSSTIGINTFDDILMFGCMTFLAGFVLVLVFSTPLLILDVVCVVVASIAITKEGAFGKKAGISGISGTLISILVLVAHFL
ncbi:hypothetical protein [Acetivibrio cellulolyticus]|uniref:hypothetical protein n=1 Tax=Acetivibrio cellulolyticus TaxID=35830 RepID=UPI0001E2D19B|nr:hypothetical protein [Acetivibrio cellulolyticus]